MPEDHYLQSLEASREPWNDECDHTNMEVQGTNTVGTDMEIYMFCLDCEMKGVKILDLTDSEGVDWDENDK